MAFLIHCLELRTTIPVVGIVLALCTAQPALALDIRETVWGFDGQVVLQRFNLLSVLVDNPSANAFEGTIELRKVMMGGGQVDAVLVEPVYLAPNSSRWVQYYPYVKSDMEGWELSWGAGGNSKSTPPTARSGVRASILLEDPDAISRSAGAIKRLADNLFPPHSTATDSLAAVVLDHVPRWDPARQKSFLEWLGRGGRVYLLQGADGKFPEFAGELHLLNIRQAKSRMGSGTVHRVERSLRQLDALFISSVVAVGHDPGSPAAVEPAPVEPAKGTDADGEASIPFADGNFINSRWEAEGTLLTNLKRMSNPEHRWFLMHLLAWIYLGLVFPGCFAIGRKYRGDFRVTFGSLLGGVAVFSFVFFVVGRRGYNEATVIHSVALARQPQPGLFDVTQWSNAFVVAGGDYSFTHDGAGRIYSSCQDEELVRGEIRNGPDAHFLADLPPYSSRAFSHRSLIAAPPIEAEIEDWSSAIDPNPPPLTIKSLIKQSVPRDERVLRKLTLRKLRNLPAERLELFVLYGRKLYRLKETGDKLVLSDEAGPLSTLIKVGDYTEYGSLFASRGAWQPGVDVRREPTTKDVYKAMFYPLVARNLELADQLAVEQFSFPPDRARLFIYAPLPAALFEKEAVFVNQDGYVLYSLDVFEPEPR